MTHDDDDDCDVDSFIFLTHLLNISVVP